MTYDQLKELVIRIYEPAEVMLNAAGFGLPRVINHAANAFWVHQPEETEDHQEMRRQLLYQEEHGMFDVERS